MAFDVDRKYQAPKTRKWFFKFGGQRVVRGYRSARRSLGGAPTVVRRAASVEDWRDEIFAIDWERAARDFRTRRYAFLDPFLSSDFHERFARHWPSRAYLQPAVKATKWYDTGYHWKNGREAPCCHARNAALDLLIDALGRPAFLDPLSEAVGGTLEFHELHVTDSGSGAEVPMHMDSLVKGARADNAVGIAIFVNGTGSDRSGGLAVSASSSWDDLLFEPVDLDNTALLYSKRLHHGFRPIAPGKFRRSINTRFRAPLTAPAPR